MYLIGVNASDDLKTKNVKVEGEEKEYPIVVVDSWGKYMQKEKLLKAQVKKVLNKEFKKIKKNKSREINIKIMGTMENGEQIIGTQYLHNSRNEVGGFTIKGTAKKDKKGKVTAKLSFVWNDIIDANKEYDTDNIKDKFAKTLFGSKPTDYIIRVKWSSKVVMDSEKGRDNKSTWPYK